MNIINKKIGRAGSGDKIHIVSVIVRPSDGETFESIFCGAQQFNGSGHGHLSRSAEFDANKVTCKKCLKMLNK